MNFSKPALLQWARMLSSFKCVVEGCNYHHPNSFSIDAVYYQHVMTPGVDYNIEEQESLGMRHYVMFNLQVTTPETYIRQMAERLGAMVPKKAFTDIALNVTITTHQPHSIRQVKLDVIDVEPGHDMRNSPSIFERYYILKTQNSYHLYPRQNVTGDNGGSCIKDMQWSKGFIRITESNYKGPITHWSPA